jgi:hypothetical protein
MYNMIQKVKTNTPTHSHSITALPIPIADISVGLHSYYGPVTIVEYDWDNMMVRESLGFGFMSMQIAMRVTVDMWRGKNRHRLDNTATYITTHTHTLNTYVNVFIANRGAYS